MADCGDLYCEICSEPIFAHSREQLLEMTEDRDGWQGDFQRGVMEVVEWVDSSYRSDEINADELPEPIKVQSCGFVVEERDDWIVLALTRFDSGTLRQTTSIPKCCIVKRFSLRAMPIITRIAEGESDE